MRRIQQSGVSNFAYPGAVHTRFDHRVGVTHAAHLIDSNDTTTAWLPFGSGLGNKPRIGCHLSSDVLNGGGDLHFLPVDIFRA